MDENVKSKNAQSYKSPIAKNPSDENKILFSKKEKIRQFILQGIKHWRERFNIAYKKRGVLAIFPKPNLLVQIGGEMSRVVSLFLASVVAIVIIGVTIIILIFSLIWPKLPNLNVITNYEPILPMKIFTKNYELIKEFGVEKRQFTAYSEYPKHLVQALVAGEDKRFFTHLGFDPIGIGRAVLQSAKSGQTAKGTSTITQQLARNFYLTQDRSLWRKGLELLLAIKIENELTKEKILEVYMNQIYLGERSFGFASAAQTYFAKEVRELTIGESAILASLPKFPSVNPFTNPERILERKEYVLKRMLEDGYINQEQFTQALAEKLPEKEFLQKSNTLVEADYIAEMARQYVIEIFKNSGVENYEELAYSRGIKVVTTINSDRQKYANDALRKGIVEFELEKSFTGEEKKLTAAQLPTNTDAEFEKKLNKLLTRFPFSNLLLPAVITAVDENNVEVYIQGGEKFTIDIKKDKKVAGYFNNSKSVNHLTVGSVVRIYKTIKKNTKDNSQTVRYQITQLPEITGAFVAMNPKTGAIEALVGGFSYDITQFNNVLQAWRQPGSTFKPFIYSAGVDLGLAPATIYIDQPLRINIPGQVAWEPKNYGGLYRGAMTVRQALANSVNTVTVQIMQDITPKYVHKYLERFGFDTTRIPAVLSLALGSGEATPMQMVRAYSVFANGGYLVEPNFILEITDSTGKELFKNPQKNQLVEENLKLDPRNAYIMDDLLKDVTVYGTAGSARSIGRNDIAGKTGTTNDSKDVWFCGFQPSLTAVVWMGYRNPVVIGRGATGGRLALPIWIDFMSKALKGEPEEPFKRPGNIGSAGGDLILKEYERRDAQLDELLDDYSGQEGEEEIPNNQQPRKLNTPDMKFF